MNTRTELENKMVEELQRQVNELYMARKNKDNYTENYWSNRLLYSRKFAEDVTGKVVRVEKRRVIMEDVDF